MEQSVVSIIKVGNSKGIRLSKSILDRYQFGKEIHLISEKDHVVLKPLPQPRKGWEKFFSGIKSRETIKLKIEELLRDENAEYCYE